METRPAPVSRLGHQLHADRIEEDIAEDGEQVMVLLNRKTLEASLPDMPVTSVMPMIATDMTGHPPLHKRAEGGLSGWLHDQMEMIGHQAETENLDGMSGLGRAEQIEEGGIVAVLVKDSGAAVATVQHVIGMADTVAARNARHRGVTIEGEEFGRQWKSSLSPFLIPIC